MWPFSTTSTIASSGVLRGATDWHCHLLPGVDDGIKDMADTFTLLRRYEEEGIREVWFTPHIMEDMPNTTAALRERFAEVKAAYEGGLTLHLAAENMLDTLFEERLEAGDVLPIGEAGDMLLVETSYFTAPYDLWGILRRIQATGFHPLLAHPERYLYMSNADYDRLHEMGVRLQLNLPAVGGAYSPESNARAQRLLQLGYYSFKGTDTHRVSGFENAVVNAKVKKSCLKLIANLK